jgi:hypothetical protein
LNYDHEAAVRAFLDAARANDPERYRLIVSKYPVLSRHELNHISRIELSVGLHPEARAGQSQVASVTEATFAELTLKESA